MIAGSIRVYKNGDLMIEDDVLIELTAAEKPTIEIGFDLRKKRIYLELRLADLVRQVTE